MCRKKLSIIWNLTQQCSWNCKFCCVDANYVRDLKLVNENKDIYYAKNNELNYKQKINIIEQLTPGKYSIDFSGGELFLDPLNIEVILKASEILGVENVGISTSGAFITDEIACRLKDKVRDVEMTLDYIPYKFYKYRPIGYHEYTANAIDILKKHNIRTGVQTVLTKENISEQKLLEIFSWIEEKGVDDWSLLKFFKAGRGEKFDNIEPSYEEYWEVVDYIKDISKDSKVNTCFQYLLPNHENHTLVCRAMKKSAGILPNGDVVSCFWALSYNMHPKADKFKLGNAVETPIEEIFNNPKSKYWSMSEHSCAFVDYSCKEVKII